MGFMNDLLTFCSKLEYHSLVSLISTFCPLRRFTGDAVDWRIANKIGSLSFYSKMSCRCFISSLKLKGFYQLDFLIIYTELKRKDKIFMYSKFPEDRVPLFFVI